MGDVCFDVGGGLGMLAPWLCFHRCCGCCYWFHFGLCSRDMPLYGHTTHQQKQDGGNRQVSKPASLAEASLSLALLLTLSPSSAPLCLDFFHCATGFNSTTTAQQDR
jgi:hypothetical protein